MAGSSLISLISEVYLHKEVKLFMKKYERTFILREARSVFQLKKHIDIFISQVIKKKDCEQTV